LASPDWLIKTDLRILPVAVDDDGTLDSYVVAIEAHFAGTASEAACGVTDRVVFRRACGKRWLYTGSLKRHPSALKLLRPSNFDDHIQSVAKMARSASNSGFSARAI
jgi:hypothetical protein